MQTQMNKPVGCPFMRITEAATFLGVTTRTIHNLIYRGDLRPIRKLRHIRIPISELERFVNFK
jgi:excisionase family DNA binding protein